MDTWPAPRSRSTVLHWAGIYNVGFGAFAVLFPAAAFTILGYPPPDLLASALWQCIGMIVGVYGLGYWIAARDVERHYPIVLVGLLGKILGPIGFVWAASQGAVGWRFLVWIVLNDLVWWIPFARALGHAARASLARDAEQAQLSAQEALETARLDGGTGKGHTLAELSRKAPLLVVMLRHSGCVFCREAVARIAVQRQAIETTGKQIVLVHMSEDSDMEHRLARHGLADLGRLSDRKRDVYRALGLRHGTISEIAAPSVWWRAFVAAIVHRHGFGAIDGDAWQMPGTFLVEDARITWGRQLGSVAEVVDFAAIAREEKVALARTPGTSCYERTCAPATAAPLQL